MSTRYTTSTVVRSVVIAIPLAVVVLASCHTSVRPSGANRNSVRVDSSMMATSGESTATLEGRSHDVLTAAQIAKEPGLLNGHALDVIQRLRPMFLEPRGLTALGVDRRKPIVFVDRNRLGEPEMLVSVSAKSIADILYLRPRDAVNRFGAPYSSGVILVRTR